MPELPSWYIFIARFGVSKKVRNEKHVTAFASHILDHHNLMILSDPVTRVKSSAGSRKRTGQ